MASLGFRKKILFCLFLILGSFIFSEELSSGEKKALLYLQKLTFEVTRYNATGLSSLPESPLLSEISRTASKLMLQHKIKFSVRNPVYLCEFYLPENIGIIDASISPEDLHSSQFDSNWIDFELKNYDSFSASISESFDINDGSKILDALENNDSRGVAADSEGVVEQKKKEIPKEFEFTKNDGRLRRFTYDGEQLTVWKEKDNTIEVNFYGDKLIRKTFDSLYRLSKKEIFKTATKARDMCLSEMTDYFYDGTSNLPEKSISMQYSSKKRLENHFDENGRLVYLLESHYEESEKDLYNDKSSSKMYDSEGRVTEENTILWSYKKNSFGRLVTSKRTLKNEYDYSQVSAGITQTPNLSFYEDGALHLCRKYTGFDSYSEKIYFDGGFSVEILYEAGIKKTEIIYMNDVEQRRRNFEY